MGCSESKSPVIKEPVSFYYYNESETSSASQENSNGHDHEMATNGAEEIDESLYSRQLYVLGADAMKKMSKSRYETKKSLP